MVSHLVLFRLRKDLTAPEREGLVTALRAAIQTIPTVRGFRIGRRLRIGAGYESAAPDLNLGGVIEFEDEAGLRVYLEHPAHEEIGARFNASVEQALVYDYEMAGLDGIGVLEGPQA